MIMLTGKVFFNFSKTMTPQDFASRTREQWIEFETIKNNAFEETVDEKTTREATERKQALLQVKQKLATVWITVTKMPNTFAPLFDQYIKANPKMKEWLWEDLQTKIDYYSANHNTLREFAKFVLAY